MMKLHNGKSILHSAHLTILSGFDTEMGQNHVQCSLKSAHSHWS